MIIGGTGKDRLYGDGNDTTVHDDGERDTLTGGSGSDWFLYDTEPGQTAEGTDVHRNETITDIDLGNGEWTG